MKSSIAILGGGNGAHTMAGDLALRGYRVRMYEDAAFIGRLSVLQQTLTIRCKGLINGSGKIEMLTADMAKAIDGVKFIAVVTPSTAHVAVAQKLKGLVKKDQVILIYPGGFGALEFKKVLGEECPVIVQTNNLPYDTRIDGPASIYCSGMSPVSVAMFPADADRAILDEVMDISPFDKIYEDVLESDLSLVNPSVHSGPCLINIGAIEQQALRGQFCMYEHFTFGAAKIDWAIDAERKAVGAALGYHLTPLEDFCEPKGELKWQDIYQKMHGAPELTPITGPDTIWNRYLTEDCPNGLVPWSELGRLCGVPTPTMDAVISIYSLVHERDWRGIGIKLDTLGLDGMTAEEIRSYLKTGKK
ncbi:MAG: NAD/NADP octopine/nopaline dehydrogenase family protein [Oscillospiraceae bacterium]|nr:NAD/NADP octopine/nopaline dehydrogenase family protein [Oscillospiraceae bacterium]